MKYKKDNMQYYESIVLSIIIVNEQWLIIY